MIKIIFIMSMLFLISCIETTPKKCYFTFQLPQKEVFVKTSKQPEARFIMYFALDSLSLENSKDSIEYRTGSYINIIVNKTDIYVNSDGFNGTILNMGKNHFNIEFISDNTIFNNTFFENHEIKFPYSFISIDTKEYSIWVNGQIIKSGDIHGGW